MTPSFDFLSHALDPQAQDSVWQLPSGLAARWAAPGIVELGDAGDSVLISCGVHGNETAPIEVMAAMLSDIASGRLQLRCRLMVAFGNLDAIRAGQRYLDYDMNRLFNGAHARQGDPATAARAALLEQHALAFLNATAPGKRRLHYDLHTAIRGSAFEKFAIYPFPHQRAHNREQLAWLAHCGIEAVLLHSAPANTFSYATSRHAGAESFTLELGKARPFGQNDLARFSGIDRALRELVSGAAIELPPYQASELPLFRAKYDLIKHSEAFILHLADDVENFTQLPDGMLLAEDGDIRYVAQGGDERILFPNPAVKPGLRAGIVVEPATLP